jgi:hypothetical protein
MIKGSIFLLVQFRLVGKVSLLARTSDASGTDVLLLVEVNGLDILIHRISWTVRIIIGSK